VRRHFRPRPEPCIPKVMQFAALEKEVVNIFFTSMAEGAVALTHRRCGRARHPTPLTRGVTKFGGMVQGVGPFHSLLQSEQLSLRPDYTLQCWSRQGCPDTAVRHRLVDEPSPRPLSRESPPTSVGDFGMNQRIALQSRAVGAWLRIIPILRTIPGADSTIHLSAHFRGTGLAGTPRNLMPEYKTSDHRRPVLSLRIALSASFL